MGKVRATSGSFDGEALRDLDAVIISGSGNGIFISLDLIFSMSLGSNMYENPPCVLITSILVALYLLTSSIRSFLLITESGAGVRGKMGYHVSCLENVQCFCNGTKAR